MSGLNVENLVKEKVYSTISSVKDSLLIFRADISKDTEDCYYVSCIDTNTEKLLNKDYFNTTKALQNIREATQDEIDWLKACEKAGKFIPKDQVKTGFKKDDYIVITKDEKTHYNGKLNYCYRLLNNAGEISPSNRIPLDNNSGKEARYATKEEIEHYDKIGKPYNVTTLIKSEYLKPEELIEGEWYEFRHETSAIYIAKFHHINSDKKKIYTIPVCNKKTGQKFKDHWFNLVEYTIKLADPQEVLKYFPEEYSTENSWIPQIGDWCYIINREDSLLDSGKVYKLNNIWGDMPKPYHFDLDGKNEKNECCWLTRESFRKAIPSEIPNNKLTFEEALIECKRRYPIGTKFYSINKEHPNGEKDVTYTVVGDKFIEWNPFGKKIAIAEKDTHGILWYNGVFAEIVGKDNNSLKVGDWGIGLSDTSLGSIYYNNGVKAFKILSIDYNNSRFTYQHINKEGKSWESSDYNLNLIRKATNSEIPITRVSGQENIKAKSILDDLEDWEETKIEVEVTFKPKEVSKPKKTRLQLHEEIKPIKVEEVVKLTVKSKINKNK
jgi:hypothetical protein